LTKALITDNAEELCKKDTGCDLMFHEKKLDELEILYRQFHRRDPEADVHIVSRMIPYLNETG